MEEIKDLKLFKEILFNLATKGGGKSAFAAAARPHELDIGTGNGQHDTSCIVPRNAARAAIDRFRGFARRTN